MADDLSLLFRIKGDSSGGVKAAAETRAAVAQLQSQMGTHFGQMQRASQTAFVSIGNNLNQFATQHIPLVGNALQGLTSQLAETAAATEGTGASMAALGGPVGIAVTAIAALAAGAVLAGKALFDLTVSTADWQGKLKDLSQQTGVSVETLSALDTLAATTGSSIEAIAASLGIFQKNLEEAQDPTSKMGKLLGDLKIQTNNTEQAFNQTLKVLSQMPEGFHQTALALEIFGRGGKSILAILKETGGNLDEAKKKFRELGILLEGETSEQADAFNDELEIVQRQLRATTALLVREVMPQILEILQKVSQFITENRQTIQAWGVAIGDTVRGIRIVFESNFGVAIINIIKATAEAMNPLIIGLEYVLQLLRYIGKSDQKTPTGPDLVAKGWHPGASVPGAEGMPNLPPRPRGSGGGRGGGRSTKNTDLQDAISDAALAEKERIQQINADVAENKRALDEQVRDIQEFTRRAIELAEQRHDAEIDRINAEQEALDTAHAKKLISEKEYHRKDRELALENAEAKQKFEDEKFDLEQQRDKAIAAAEVAHNERSFQISKEAADRQIGLIKYRVSKGVELESEGEKKIAALIQEMYRQRKALLEDELNRITTSAARRAEINDELIRLEGERAGAAVNASHQITDALDKEAAKLSEIGGLLASGGAEGVAGTNKGGSPGDAFDQLNAALQEHLSGDTLTAAQAGVQVLATAFQQLGQAVGEAVHAFVLFGNAGGGIRKFTATLIAEIARMAAVQAIWELAQGFAMLALNFFWPDPKLAASATAHFHAAAIYGGMAAIAAGAGRLVAGDAFKQPSAGGGGSGSRTGSSGATRNAPDVTDINRRAVQPVINITVVGQATEGFRYMVEKVAVDSVRLNGPFRKIQNGEDV